MNNQNNYDLEKLLKLFGSSQNKEKLLNNVKSNLSNEQKTQIQNIMNDRDALNNLLNTPQAKELLRRIKENK